MQLASTYKKAGHKTTGPRGEIVPRVFFYSLPSELPTETSWTLCISEMLLLPLKRADSHALSNTWATSSAPLPAWSRHAAFHNELLSVILPLA